MKYLILHIGLPKTATTTMQYDIFALPANRPLYLGKYPQGDNTFHMLISDYLSGRRTLDRTQHLIASYLEGPTTCVYSNEMITVNSAISWREKMRLLRDLFADIPVKVIATTRLPSQHAQSVYAEMLPVNEWSDLGAFLASDQSDWLDPSILHEAIIDSGLATADRIMFYDFDTLVSQEFRPLATAIPGLVFPNSISNLNSRRRVGSGMVSRPIGIDDFAYSIARRLGLLHIVPARFRGSIGRLLRAIPITWRRKIELSSDSPTLETLDLRYVEAMQKLSAFDRKSTRNG